MWDVAVCFGRPFKRPKIEDGGNSASDLDKALSTSGRDISALVGGQPVTPFTP